MKILGTRKRLRSAIDIERVVRGHFGRRRFTMFRKIKRVDRHRQYLLEREKEFEERFQKEGHTIVALYYFAVL